MKFILLLVVLSSFLTALAQAQTNTQTGKTKIDEEAYNTQLEKCKVDTNVTPSVNNTKPAATSTGTKGKAQ